MAQSLRRSAPLTPKEDRSKEFKTLIGQLAKSGRTAARHAAAGLSDARRWDELTDTVAQRTGALAHGHISILSERDLILTAVAELRRAGSGRVAAYSAFTDDIARWHDSWSLAVPPRELAVYLHHAMLWHTAQYLLSAGLSLGRVSQILQANPSRTPRAVMGTRAAINRTPSTKTSAGFHSGLDATARAVVNVVWSQIQRLLARRPKRDHRERAPKSMLR